MMLEMNVNLIHNKSVDGVNNNSTPTHLRSITVMKDQKMLKVENSI